MAKNILVFSTVYLPMIGGAELAIKEITDRLPEYKFYLITARMNRQYLKTEKIGNIEVKRVGFGCACDKFLLPVLGFFKARSIAKEKKIDLAWAVMASYGGIAALFFKKLRPDIPFLLTLQEGDYFPEKKLGLAGLFFKKIVQNADYIQTISNYLKEEAVKAGAKAEIEVVPNGVDLKRIKNQESRIKNVKNELGLKDDDRIIITVSRLVPKNGVDIIIDAFNVLKTKHRLENIKLLIVGDGFLRKDLELKTKNYQLKTDVIFPGSVSPDDVYSYLAISDVFVRPSRSEGLGSAFLEAMACGVPIVATPVGGIPDFLEDRETGLFCEVDNSDNLALKIKELLENENLREAIIQNGLKLVKEKYSWDNIALQMKKILKKVEN